MKKLLFVAVFALGLSSAAFAQTNERAIGIRLGSGAEFSYQHPLSNNMRFQIDLGARGYTYPSFLATGTFQWIFPINNGFDWFIGVGPQMGGVSYYSNKNDRWVYGFDVGVAGIGGVQYNFDFPLQLSADYRPSWLFINPGGVYHYYGLYDFGVSARYRF